MTFRFGSKKSERLVIVDEEEKYSFVCLIALKVSQGCCNLLGLH